MELAGLSGRIDRFSLIPDGSLELRLAGTTPGILIGPHNWKRSLARVAALRRELGDELSRFSEIDLRHGACAALRRADGGM
jgi:hypothetical protein